MVEGDVELGNGIKLYKTPGHSLGSQCVYFMTEFGPRIVVADLFHFSYMMFPRASRMLTADGEVKDITPLPEIFSPVLVNNVIYDHYAFFESFYKIMSLVPKYEPQYFVCGHDGKVVVTGIKNDFDIGIVD